MARLPWLIVAGGWMLVIAGYVRARARRRPHRRWELALETLGKWSTAPDPTSAPPVELAPHA